MLALLDELRIPGGLLTKQLYNLEALGEILEERDEVWKKEYYNAWGILEEVYAVALNNGQSSFLGLEEKYIEEGIEQLRKLVKQKIVENESL
jgi:hypothetical protein